MCFFFSFNTTKQTYFFGHILYQLLRLEDHLSFSHFVAIQRFSIEQRILIVKTHYKNGECYAETVRKLRAIFGRDNSPTATTVSRLVQKFEASGSVATRKSPGRNRNVRTQQNIAVVQNSVKASPVKSLRRRSQQLGMSTFSVHRILKKDLHMYPYKIQLTQELKPADHAKRRRFVDWILMRQQEDDNFSKRIIFSDEAHFHLSGYVNKENCRIWGDENPRVIQEHEMHPLRATVWCGFWAGGIIGPFFFEDDDGNSVTVTGNRYRGMITNFLWPALEKMEDDGIDEMWFQQDGATCHTSRETITLLREKFPERLISLHGGDQEWPSRSCDLTPCNFFLWGYVKSQVYVNKPQTIAELKREIQRLIDEIYRDVCKRVIINFNNRMTACRESEGEHMLDIIFHY